MKGERIDFAGIRARHSSFPHSVKSTELFRCCPVLVSKINLFIWDYPVSICQWGKNRYTHATVSA